MGLYVVGGVGLLEGYNVVGRRVGKIVGSLVGRRVGKRVGGIGALDGLATVGCGALVGL